MNDITAIIKTFKRPSKMKKTIDYALKAGIDKILIGYDGPNRLYNYHKRIIDDYDDRVKFHKFDFNVGLSYVRNRLLELTKTKYLFLLDCDQYIHPKTLNYIDYLENHKNIGVVGFPLFEIRKDKNILNGKYKNWCFDIKIENGEIKSFISHLHLKQLNGIYIVTGMDTLENCAIFKVDMLNEMKGWDENYIISREHLDFYLRRKLQYPHWKLASAVNVYVIHEPGPGWFSYNSRYISVERKKSQEYFRKKWKARKMTNLGKNPYDYNPMLSKFKKYQLDVKKL